MYHPYVEQREGGYWVQGTRVSLDSVVYRFREGLSPESIAECFSGLSLEQVYGTITYYLAQRAKIDAYLKTADEEEERFRQRVRTEHPRLSRKLDALLRSAQPSDHENPVSGR